MSISISVIDKKPKKKWGSVGVEGILRINDFEEYLYLSVDWWQVDDYLLQWKEGFERLLSYDTSCLIVDINDPCLNRKFVDWWLLYKVGDKVHIQNQLVIGEIYEKQIGDKPFNLQTCYDFIPDRGEPYDEDGNKISEWVIDWDSKVV